MIFCFRYNRIIIIGKWHCNSESKPKPQSVRRCTQWFVAQWWCLMREARIFLNWKCIVQGDRRAIEAELSTTVMHINRNRFFFSRSIQKFNFIIIHIATCDILYNNLYRICWRHSLYSHHISSHKWSDKNNLLRLVLVFGWRKKNLSELNATGRVNIVTVLLSRALLIHVPISTVLKIHKSIRCQ